MAQSSDLYLVLTDGDIAHQPGSDKYTKAEDVDLEERALSMFTKEMTKQPGRNIAKGEFERLCFSFYSA